MLELKRPQFNDPADIREITDNFDDIVKWAGETDISIDRRAKLSDINEIAPSISYNDVQMSDLIQLLSIIPKLITGFISISLLPGTIPSTINIAQFYGPGELSITGANSASSLTHNIASMNITRCQCRVSIQGITATNTTGNGFLIQQCSQYIYINMCNCTLGSNLDTGNIGFNSNENAGFAYFSQCNASNKYQAIRCGMGSAYAVDLLGSGNNIVYRSEYGGTIHRRTAGTIAGTTLTSKTSSGIIINPDSTFA